ncbi:MAG: signal recognition particle-docking protein FtsY [Deltaproteobacteria bacterium]|nr:signal recognition particle-docking protein FtsY [Deltaproteobacteria bacterium]
MLIAVGAILIVAVGVGAFLLLRRKRKSSEKVSVSLALSKTREIFKGVVSKGKGTTLESVREALLAVDVGPQVTEQLLSRLQEQNHRGPLLEKLREAIRSDLKKLERAVSVREKPFVILFVGVNGVGKTTTIAKVAHGFQKEGRSVLLAAADTFRAGATGQLKTWADRLQIPCVMGQEGADPASIAFQAIESAKAKGMDVVLIDSAGRLHTEAPLMDQLKKIQRVSAKALPQAPHETWLVLDGTLGINTVEQVRQFQKALSVSGLVITKLDGSAKGGSLIAVAQSFQIPVYFVGIGETLEALIPFSSEEFVRSLFLS